MVNNEQRGHVSESALVRLVDRYFVWVVVMLAALDAVGQAIDSLIQRRLLSLLAWILIALSMFVGTYLLETVKSRRRAS